MQSSGRSTVVVDVARSREEPMDGAATLVRPKPLFFLCLPPGRPRPAPLPTGGSSVPLAGAGISASGQRGRRALRGRGLDAVRGPRATAARQGSAGVPPAHRGGRTAALVAPVSWWRRRPGPATVVRPSGRTVRGGPASITGRRPMVSVARELPAEVGLVPESIGGGSGWVTPVIYAGGIGPALVGVALGARPRIIPVPGHAGRGRRWGEVANGTGGGDGWDEG